jgi:hypothetical protein
MLTDIILTTENPRLKHLLAEYDLETNALRDVSEKGARG